MKLKRTLHRINRDNALGIMASVCLRRLLLSTKSVITCIDYHHFRLTRLLHSPQLILSTGYLMRQQMAPIAYRCRSKTTAPPDLLLTLPQVTYNGTGGAQLTAGISSN